MANTELKLVAIGLVLAFMTLSCGGEEIMNPNPGSQEPLSEVTVADGDIIEGNGAGIMTFAVTAAPPSSSEITFNYQISGVTADPQSDFSSNDGQGVIPSGGRSFEIQIQITDDDQNEVDEKIRVDISNVQNGILRDGIAFGIIRDDDDPTSFNTDGYFTADNHFGYDLTWQDEFDGESLDTDVYSFEIGDGCPDLCNWGNNELQEYSADAANIKLEDGKLVITAIDEGANQYSSSRMYTQDKLEIQYGRIDIRAKLPTGQGMWPALWMLGANIDQVGWPACGEIDIVEIFGNEPQTVIGTGHWGPQGSTTSTYNSSYFTTDVKVDERFFVYSLVWEPNDIQWYVDETLYKRLTPAELGEIPFPYNAPFYFIFNVAVGGNGIGDPDDTTMFPATMQIDYIRVFQ
jgi:beta-glucanase (GH16 family)